MGILAGIRERFHFFAELWAFMRVRKKFWLAPIMIVLAILAVLIVATSNPVVAPFIYALF